MAKPVKKTEIIEHRHAVQGEEDVQTGRVTISVPDYANGEGASIHFDVELLPEIIQYLVGAYNRLSLDRKTHPLRLVQGGGA